ncbi:MAG: TetR/AcrR family transcriptional regulator [Rhodococcus sp.]|nr:TetR/AcrR family transcriptional regulator [Rhodococcus sp. (in: high G+C Gram-positive bacteria)]
MLSNSNDDPSIEERILDAAASCAIDFGVERVTLSEIARRAGVSRPTIYRRWEDANSIIVAALTREVVSTIIRVEPRGDRREDLVDRIIRVVRLLQNSGFIDALLDSGATVLMTYVTKRLGTSQYQLIEAGAAEIRRHQRTGEVREGNPQQLATMVMLIAQSAIQSAHMVEKILDIDSLERELAYSLNGYLKP